MTPATAATLSIPVIISAYPGRPTFYYSTWEPTKMDKKAKKKVDILNQRLQKLRQQLAGAKKQMDEPEDVRRLESEIDKAETEIRQIKGE